MKVLTFGELLLRLSAPGYDKLFQNNSFNTSFCGGEANVSVSLANFGIPTAFLTKLPDNDVGMAATHSLDYFRVDTSKIFYGKGRMGLYYLEKGASQRPSKVIYDREFSAISMAKPEEFDWDKLFEDVTWFHFTGINPALSENLILICEQACKKAKEKGITVSCDLNFRGKLWSADKASAVMPSLIKYVDVCIGNEEDAEKTLGIGNKSDINSGKLDKNGYVEIAREIKETYGCKYVAITLRESISASINGWSAMLYDGHPHFSNRYEIQLVDRVGGGDSFSGGLIYGLITGMNSQDAIEFATAASCLKQCIEGDFNRVTVDEINSLIKNGGNGRVQR